MDSQIKNQSVLQRVMPWTGIFPAVSCWVVVILALGDRVVDQQTLKVFGWLAVASVIMLLISRYHFKKTEAGMWLQNPAIASLKWMGMNVLIGYLLLSVPMAIYGLVVGGWTDVLAAFIYLFFAVIPAFPGIVIGFYVQAHALSYKDGFSYRKLFCCRAA